MGDKVKRCKLRRQPASPRHSRLAMWGSLWGFPDEANEIQRHDKHLASHSKFRCRTSSDLRSANGTRRTSYLVHSTRQGLGQRLCPCGRSLAQTRVLLGTAALEPPARLSRCLRWLNTITKVGKTSPAVNKLHQRNNRGPSAAPNRATNAIPTVYQSAMNVGDVSPHVSA
jgi:hypothetical protein